jgi:hypothetical protein
VADFPWFWQEKRISYTFFAEKNTLTKNRYASCEKEDGRLSVRV